MNVLDKPPLQDLRLCGCKILFFMSILLLCLDLWNWVTLSSIRRVTIITSDIVLEIDLLLNHGLSIAVQSFQFHHFLCWLHVSVVILLILWTFEICDWFLSNIKISGVRVMDRVNYLNLTQYKLVLKTLDSILLSYLK